MPVTQPQGSIHMTLGALQASVGRMEQAFVRGEEKSSENRRRMYDQLREISEQTTRQTENIATLTRVTEKNSVSIDALTARLSALEHSNASEKDTIANLKIVTKRFESYEQRAFGMKAGIAAFMALFGTVVYNMRDKILKFFS